MSNEPLSGDRTEKVFKGVEGLIEKTSSYSERNKLPPAMSYSMYFFLIYFVFIIIILLLPENGVSKYFVLSLVTFVSLLVLAANYDLQKYKERFKDKAKKRHQPKRQGGR